MIVYLATNKINGKQYVGLTSLSLEKRKKVHVHDAKYKDKPFQRALRKYGVDGFEWSILRKCRTEKSLGKWERYFIRKFGTYGNGYNANKGGVYHTEKGLQRLRTSLSEKMLGHKMSLETKRKIGDAIRGRKHTDDARLKMSKFHKGKKTWNTGLKMTDEWKQVRSKSGMGKKKPGTSIAMKKKWAQYRKLHGEK